MASTTINSTKAYGITPAAGYGNLGAYTPTLFAMEVLEKFYISTVFGAIANTKYEGIITKQGDKVVIRTRPDVIIKDYIKGQKLDYDSPEPAEVELIIDKAKYYALNIDDIDKIQNDISAMEQWSLDAGFQLAIAIDRQILNGMYASASSSNVGATAGKISGGFNLGATGGSAVQITKTNILDYIVDAETVLNEQNIPVDNRYIIMPAYFYGLLEKSDLRSALFTGDSSNKVLRNGLAGRIANFDIYVSNNIQKVSDSGVDSWPIIFGHKVALTFASQLVKNETLPNPESFGNLMRGLQVYGYNVVKPDALGYIWAKK